MLGGNSHRRRLAMQKGWLKKTIGGRTIEHVPCPNPGAPVDLSAPHIGVLHTIEGTLESGMGVFHRHYAPHFALDAHRTLQLIPLGTMGAALENDPGGVETNSITRVQIEAAGSSRTSPWLWDDATTNAVADLIATMEHVADVPLERPFPDAMPPLPWSNEAFSRRHAGKWGHTAGWFGHVEVPENAHWDPGALKWTELLRRARSFAGSGSAESQSDPEHESAPATLPDWYWTWLAWHLGEGEFKDFGPRSAAHRPDGAPDHIPAWAWAKASQFVLARKGPH
jgi:hypothetical protein